MANMSYCRFRNTLDDLRDCREAIANREEISHEEKNAARELIRECASLVEYIGCSTELSENTLWRFFENYVPAKD